MPRKSQELEQEIERIELQLRLRASASSRAYAEAYGELRILAKRAAAILAGMQQ